MENLENDIRTLRNKIEKGMKVEAWFALVDLCCVLFFTKLGIYLNKVNIFLVTGIVMLLFSCFLHVYNFFKRKKSLDELNLLECSGKEKQE